MVSLTAQYAITELSRACFKTSQYVQNISYRDEFNLHENSDLEGGTDFHNTSEWFRTKTRTQLQALHQ